MRKIFILLIILFDINLNLFSQDLIINIEMKYTDYYREMRTDLMDNYLFNDYFNKDNCSFVEKVNITNSTSIKKIVQCLENAKTPINVDICEDLLIGIKIYHFFGKIDTIAFGRCYVMLYNDNFYKPDLELLKTIIPYMDKKYQKDYYFYVKELEKFFEND